MGGIVGGRNAQQTVNQNMTSTPWGPQIPYILEMFKRAQSSLDARPEGYGVNKAAEEQIRKTLSGDYLYGNAESKKAIDAITTDTMNRAMPAVDSKFAEGGRYGSGLHKAALGQQIADTSAAAMAKNYAAERANQVGAIGMAPGISDALDWRQQRLRDFASMVSQNFGGTQTGSSTQSLHRNPFAGLMGGALMGSRFGPWGAIGGGAIGLLG